MVVPVPNQAASVDPPMHALFALVERWAADH